MSLDEEIRSLERQLIVLRGRAGDQLIHRPTSDIILPPDPWDGEQTSVFSFPEILSVKIWVSGDAIISLQGVCTSPNGYIRPSQSNGSGYCLVQLMALKEKRTLWISTKLCGTWTLDS